MNKPQKFMRRRAVLECTGLSNSTMYEMMAGGRFPRPVRLSDRAVGWIACEIADWQSARIAEREAEREAV